MSLTKAVRRNKQNQAKLLRKLKIEQGDYTGLYYYNANVTMSETKAEVATRPELIVGHSAALGHLVVPYSRNKLREYDHLPIVLPGSKKLSYHAPNRAYWVQGLPNARVQHLPMETWEQALDNLRLITVACIEDEDINLSLNDWLSKAAAVSIL